MKTPPRRRDRHPAARVRTAGSEPPPPTDPDASVPAASDPAALARAATLASGQAMQERRWEDAKALAALAENYARLGARVRGGGPTIQTMDLRLLYDVLVDETGAAVRRMDINPDDHNDPDRALKSEFHAWSGSRSQAVPHHQLAMLFRIHAAEAQIKELGGEVVVSQSSFDEVADARAWLTDQALALDEVTVTPSPPPGNPWAIGR